MANGGQNTADKNQHAGQHTQLGGSGITPIALTFWGLLNLLQRIVAQSARTKQRCQVIGQHFGFDINDCVFR